MKKYIYLALGALALSSVMPAWQADQKSTARTLKVKLNYTGSGTVDEKHKIIVFLFDTPDFAQGGVMPMAMEAGTSKDAVVTFADTAKSPVYAVCVYDPSGGYEGQSEPPSGSSLGMYSTTPGKADPIKIEAGQKVEVELKFDDTAKMP